MKKTLFFLLIISFVSVLFAEQRYALVIGNSNYTNFGTLRNPVNDANDMETALRSLGFNVDKLLNGSLSQMENAAVRLRNRLTEAGNDAVGFFFFAGHGVELGGVNYLIPADASIPDRNFLRDRAFPVQAMLDMLNDSRNALNIIVLDACRDFPAVWSRTVNRGLAVIASPPANHIIMYATSAGTVAADGTGRNGLFTGHLLNNLGQPGIEVSEVFRRTMRDVAGASNNQQRPALYTDFAETVYFGTRPATTEPVPAQPDPEPPAEEPVSVAVQPAPMPQPRQPAQPEELAPMINWWNLDGKNVFSVSLGGVVFTGGGIGVEIIIFEKHFSNRMIPGISTFAHYKGFINLKASIWSIGAGAHAKWRTPGDFVFFNVGFSMEYFFVGRIDVEKDRISYKYKKKDGYLNMPGMSIQSGLSYRFNPFWSFYVNGIFLFGLGSLEIESIYRNRSTSFTPTFGGMGFGITFMVPYGGR